MDEVLRAIEGLGDRISAGVRDEIGALRVQTDGMSTRIAEVGRNVADLSVTSRALVESVGTIDTRLGGLDTRLDGLDTRLNEMYAEVRADIAEVRVGVQECITAITAHINDDLRHRGRRA